MQAHEAVILGATGPMGSHLAAALNRRSIRHRAVSRNKENLEKWFVASGGELVEADAMDADSLMRAIDGFRLAYDCMGVPEEEMVRYPVMARNLAIASAKTGAKVVHVSSYWSYLPVVYLPIDEDHPREGGSDPIRYRREGEDVLVAAGAAVVGIPDIYGPLVHGGPVQRAIEEAFAGKTIGWFGAPDLEREYVYAADAMEAVVRLSYHLEAFGQRWIVGGSGPLSANLLAELAGKKLKRKVKVASVRPLKLRLRALFDEKARNALRMEPVYGKPISFNNDKVRSLIGDIPMSNYEHGIAKTIDWLARRRLVK